jgi:serine/threonine protein kinase
MLNCYRCSTPVPEKSRFCNTCGAALSDESAREHTAGADSDPELLSKLQAEVGGEYVIERELGRGGMAVVYLGHDTQLGRKVAVKVLPPELTFRGTNAIERFRREVRTAATLDHQHIIPVYRVSQGTKLFWYVMKFLDGRALDDVLAKDGRLAVHAVVSIVKQTSAALDYAHKHQVVHRDIKPGNIMVDAELRVTVTDFGIAKALDANSLTATGGIIGTPFYMSPEQCSGKRVGPPSDQYALAVMTFQMLAGKLPFSGDTMAEVVHRQITEPAPPLRKLRPELPLAMVRVVERGLAKVPEERFATCADFARALEAAALTADKTGMPAGDVSPEARFSKTAVVSPLPGAVRSAKGILRERRPFLRIAALIMIGGILSVAMVWNGENQQAPTEAAAVPGAVSESTKQDRPLPAESSLGAPTPALRSSSPPINVSAGDSPASAPTNRPTAALLPARITLVGVPGGATVTRDGVSERSNSFDLLPGQRHVVAVQMAGFVSWSDTSMPRVGERLRRNVVLEREATPIQAPAAVATQPSAVPKPNQSQPVAATGSAFITIGSRPNAAMTINGRPSPQNPISSFEVVPGIVHVRFQVTDTTGVWTVDTSFTVAAGDRLNVGRVNLRHP